MRRMQQRAMSARPWRIAASALLLALPGCGGGGGDLALDRPPEKRAVLRAPGVVETIPLALYTSPPGFALPFSTYLPPGIQADPALEGRGDGVGFEWTVGGALRDSAFVHLFVLPAGRSEGAAREVVRSAAERFRVPGDRSELSPVRVHPWAVVEYPIRTVGTAGEPVVGWVALGREGGRWFQLLVQAPASRWPRFEPRAELILEEWRWTESGRPLADEAPAE